MSASNAEETGLKESKSKAERIKELVRDIELLKDAENMAKEYFFLPIRLSMDELEVILGQVSSTNVTMENVTEIISALEKVLRER